MSGYSNAKEKLENPLRQRSVIIDSRTGSMIQRRQFNEVGYRGKQLKDGLKSPEYSDEFSNSR